MHQKFLLVHVSRLGGVMFNDNTDAAWEKYGRGDAYFGVISHDKYRNANLSDAARKEFFDSGELEIADALEKARAYTGQQLRLARALDFGCAVGRLVIPLSKVATEVVGLDVSESMLAEAKANCSERSIKNVEFFKSDDELSSLPGKFSLIYSYNVFQHIPVARGEKILRALLDRIEPGGVGILHFTYSSSKKRKRLATFLKKYVPFSPNILNVLKGKRLDEPYMQMNEYSINNLLRIIQKSGATSFQADFTDHRGEMGVVLFIQIPGRTADAP